MFIVWLYEEMLSKEKHTEVDTVATFNWLFESPNLLKSLASKVILASEQFCNGGPFKPVQELPCELGSGHLISYSNVMNERNGHCSSYRMT